MTLFVAEAYLPRARAGELGALVDRVRDAARQLAADGDHIRYLRSTFVPEDETCFHVFEANSAATVNAASALAGLRAIRVVEAIHGEGTRGSV